MAISVGAHLLIRGSLLRTQLGEPFTLRKTEAKLKEVKGVESATADREKGEVVVKYDDAKAKPADLEKAVADSGFAGAK